MKALPLILPAYLVSGLLLAQGPLDPPGPPAPSMKTAQQIEPRTPIESLPFSITKPGSYYLTKSLTSSGNGIQITSDNVTLDLNGFSLTGPAGHFGIDVRPGATPEPRVNVVVRNGFVDGFSTSLSITAGRGCVAADLQCHGATDDGIVLSSEVEEATGNVIENCAVVDAGSTCIKLFGESAELSGNTIRNCRTRGGTRGLWMISAAPGSHTSSNRIENCRFFAPSQTGILIGEGSGNCRGNSVINCDITDAGKNGIHLRPVDFATVAGTRIVGCTIEGASNGIELSGENGARAIGTIVRSCVLMNCGSYGINLEAGAESTTIANCSITICGSYGINNANAKSGLFERNTIRNATDRGISVSLGEGNTLDGNNIQGTSGAITYGIRCESASNFLIRNVTHGHDVNLFIAAGNTAGPRVSSAGTLAVTGAEAHPWANFSLAEGP